MSLLDITPIIIDTLRGDSLEYCNILDVYLDNETLHYSDMFHQININDGVEPVRTYLPLGDASDSTRRYRHEPVA